MFREAAIRKSVCLVLLCLIASSCGKSKEKQAADLFNLATESYEKGEYDEALLLIDSVSHNYASVSDVRRKVMHLRPQVIEKQTLVELSTVDSLAAVTRWQVDSLSAQMRRVNNSLEAYYVHSTEPSNINDKPGLYARMAPDATLYVIAVGPSGSDNVVVEFEGQSASTPKLARDGERNDIVAGHGILTYLEGEVENLTDFMIGNAGKTIEIRFRNGSSELSKIAMSGNVSAAFSSVVTLSKLTRQLKLLEVRRARLEKTLEVARNQTARTMADDPDGD